MTTLAGKRFSATPEIRNWKLPSKTWQTEHVPRSIAHEQDILKLSRKRPPKLTSRRIGIHTSSAGGVHNAAERAYRLGCNTLQIFLRARGSGLLMN